MKSLTLALLLIITIVFNSFAFAPEIPDTNLCLDQDVWVYINNYGFLTQPATVVVHVPKHSLRGDSENCPIKDTKVMGEGRTGPGLTVFAGMRVVTLEKGKLNDSKNYTTRAPRRIEVPDDNMNTWHVNKGKIK